MVYFLKIVLFFILFLIKGEKSTFGLRVLQNIQFFYKC